MSTKGLVVPVEFFIKAESIYDSVKQVTILRASVEIPDDLLTRARVPSQSMLHALEDALVNIKVGIG